MPECWQHSFKIVLFPRCCWGLSCAVLFDICECSVLPRLCFVTTNCVCTVCLLLGKYIGWRAKVDFKFSDYTLGLLTKQISFYSTKDNYLKSGNVHLTIGKSCSLVSCHEMVSFLYACKNKVVLEDICDYDWNTSIDLAARDGKDIRMKQFCYIKNRMPILIAIFKSGTDQNLKIFSTFLKRGEWLVYTCWTDFLFPFFVCFVVQK